MQPKSETLSVGVCNYGFSLPEKIGTSNEYCSDSDVALITVGDVLYLAYKEKNKKTIRLITGRIVLDKIEWSAPRAVASIIPGVVCETSDYPSLTYYNNKVLLFWRQPDNKNLDYGFLNPETAEIYSAGFIPDNIESKRNVAVVTGEYNNYFTFWHIGSESDKIYQAIFQNKEWSDPYIEQSSTYAPQIAAEPKNKTVLHIVHRGKSNANIYYSKNTTGLTDNWLTDKEIVTDGGNHIKTDKRPGSGFWNQDYLVVAYRDDDFIEKGFRLVYMNINDGIWEGDDYICEEVVNSDHAPALSPFTKNGENFICMAWTERGNAGAIEFSVSKNIL